MDEKGLEYAILLVLARDWRVLEKVSSSDHLCLEFNLIVAAEQTVIQRRKLIVNKVWLPRRLRIAFAIEDQLGTPTLLACSEEACLMTLGQRGSTVP